ncbi:sporulation integral membrane protein YtvI [Lentibacillus kapialis]|uniref:Sporulation integral membrane protein YtvI n=1 Tax=Lentibacillus kapialis TaxID=340214 RepID=A0A917UYJ5_9BACI|nr:sporulation integral membrane protein YtvI [Lentibacillus kapialis]GGJ96930.1 sporulation integral membrane protein YtvI [Lentibacillus kapialis]
MYKRRMHQIFRFCIIMVSVVIIFSVLQYTFSYIYPFLLAFILALCLNPAVGFLEQTIKLPRGLAAFAVMAFTATVLLGIIILLISELFNGTTYIAKNIPDYFHVFAKIVETFIDEQLMPLYHKLSSFVRTLNPDQQSAINDSIDHIIDRFTSFSADTVQNFLLQIPAALTLLPGSFTVFLFTVLAAFFLTKDWHQLVFLFKKAIPKNVLHSSSSVWNYLKKAVSGFIKAQLLLMSMTSLTIFAGLLLFQIDYALTIALIAALVDIFPFLGTGIIFVPWITYLFLTGNYSMTIGLSIIYMIVIIQRQLLEPKIVSDKLGVPPILTLIALFIGLRIWGAFGLLLGPFLMIAGKALYQAGIFHQASRFIKGS